MEERISFEEKIEKIKELVGPTTIHISRVPKEVKIRFLQIAKEEFAEDYGFFLKKLIEVYDGVYPTGHEEIEAKLDILANEVSLLKNRLNEIEKKPSRRIKMVSGKEIGGKEHEQIK